MSAERPDDRTPDSPAPRGEDGQEGPVVRDRRRIDPDTGRVRPTSPEAPGGVEAAGPEGPGPGVPGGSAPSSDAATARPVADPARPSPQVTALQAELVAAQSEVAERTEDLQRLQAEYVNYRKRVDRDRDVAGQLAVAGVIDALIPVLDEIGLAREHGELTGPFAAVAEKVEATLAKFGWERYGAVGEEFDPTVHEALMHSHSEEVTGPTVTMVLQPGYRVGARILRAARVAVSEPE